MLALAVPGYRSCRCLAQTARGYWGCRHFSSASLRDAQRKKLVRLEQKSTKVARQHAYPNEPLFQSPLEGKSSLRSTETTRADDQNVSRKVGEGM